MPKPSGVSWTCTPQSHVVAKRAGAHAEQVAGLLAPKVLGALSWSSPGTESSNYEAALAA
jgi:hypothetical protein